MSEHQGNSTDINSLPGLSGTNDLSGNALLGNSLMATPTGGGALPIVHIASIKPTQVSTNSVAGFSLLEGEKTAQRLTPLAPLKPVSPPLSFPSPAVENVNWDVLTGNGNNHPLVGNTSSSPTDSSSTKNSNSNSTLLSSTAVTTNSITSLSTTALTPLLPAVPTIDLPASSDSGVSSSDNITQVNPPVITGTAEPGTTVKLLSDGVPIGQTQSTGTWQITPSQLSQGTHLLTATATGLGGVSLPSTPLPITIDTTPPQVTLTTPLSQFNLAGTVDGTGTGIASLSYRFNNLNEIPVLVGPLGVFDQALNLTGLGSGPQTLTIKAADIAGNVTTATLQVTLNLVPPPPAIQATLTHDTAPGGTTNTDRITFDPTVNGSISVTGRSIDIKTNTGNTPLVNLLGTGLVIESNRVIEFRAGFNSTPTSNYVDVLSNLNSDGSFALNRAKLDTIYGGTLPDGTHTLHLQAKDQYNKVSTVDISFTLDITPPAEPLVNLTPASDSGTIGDRRTTAAVVTLVGQTDPGVPVLLEQTGAIVTADSTGQFAFTSIPLARGSNVFTTRATDIAGNQKIAQATLYRLSPPTNITLTNAQVAENSVTGTAIGQLNTTDPDSGETFTYSLLDNAGDRFQIVNNQLQVANGTLLDFESSTSHQITVRSTDTEGLSATQIFTINVTNANDAPIFTSTPVITGQEGSAYRYNITTSDPDLGDTRTITAAALPGGLTLVDNGDGTATLQGTPAFGFYNVNLTVQDAAGGKTVQSFTIAASPRYPLVENHNFAATQSVSLTVPSTPSILRFKVTPQFDTADLDSINDAVEVALVDSNGTSIVHTIAQGRDAFFNWSEGETVALGAGATYNPADQTVRLNLTGIAPGTTATLVFRLVNNDSDITTSVRIDDLAIAPAPIGTQPAVQGYTGSTATPAVERPNFSLLSDVSSSFSADYHRTSFNADTRLLQADIAIRNTGSYSTNAPLLVAVTHISDPTVLVRDPDGFTPDGLPYYDFSHLVPNSKLDATAATGQRSLMFYNPNGVQFTYDLIVLAELNQGPVIETPPVTEVIGGQPYRYEIKASDANNDTLTYTLLAAPQGMVIDASTGIISWNTMTGNIGNHTVRLAVSDSRGGIIEQQFTLSVTDVVPNRPPIFTTTPIVNGQINQPYSYDADATDPDQNTLTYSLGLAPEGMVINPQTGEILWTPPAVQVFGDTVYGQITAPGAQDAFTFSGTAGQQIYYDSLTGNTDLLLTIQSPSGRVLLNSNTNYEGSINLSETGTYRLVIKGRGDVVGNYGFSLIDRDAAPVAKFDTIITGFLRPGSENDVYRFSGQAGQRLYFDKLNTNNNYSWIIYRADNSEVISDGVGNDMETELPVNGDYLLVLRGQAGLTSTVEYTFQIVTSATNIVNVPALGRNATPNTVNGSISEKGEQNVYTFQGYVGQRLILDTLSGGSNMTAKLLSPSGAIALDRSLSSALPEPFALIETGIYRLVVDANGETTGSYSFNVLDVGLAEPVTIGTQISGTLQQGQATHLYQISGEKGQRLYLDQLINAANVDWVLYGPNNQRITSGLDVEITLPSTDIYTLAINGNSSAAVNYKFQVLSPKTDVATLVLGGTISGAISGKAEQARYSFTGSTNQRLFLDTLLESPALQAKLVSPSGIVVFDTAIANDTNRHPVILPEGGTYQLLITGPQEAIGDYRFRLANVSAATALTSGTPVSGELDPSSEIDLYEFTGTAGQRLYLDTLAATPNATWILYGPGNQFLSSASLGSDSEVELTANGTYSLLLRGNITTSSAIPYAFQVVATSPNTQDLTLGDTINGSIAQSGQQNTYTFFSTGSERLYVDTYKGSSNTTVKVVSPSGIEAYSSTMAGSGALFTTIETGTYRVVVDGVAATTEDYSFQVIRSVSAPTLDFVATNQGSLSGKDTILYQLNGTAGQQVKFDSLLATTGTWVLYAPVTLNSGKSEVKVANLSSDFDVLLPATGIYILALHNASNDAVDYQFQVSNLTSAFVSNTGFSTVYSGTVTASQPAERTFTANAGTFVRFDSQSSNTSATAKVIDANNNQVFSVNASNDSQVVQVQQSGTYKVRIEGSGSYQYQLLDLSAASDLTLNTAVNISLTGLGTVAYRVNSSAGQKLYYDSLNNPSSLNATVTLINASGRTVFNMGTAKSDSSLITLTESGPYYLLISNESTTASNVNFRLMNQDGAATLPLDQVESKLFAQSGTEARLYRFTGTKDQPLYFDGQSSGFSSAWTLYGPAGQILQRALLSGDFELQLPADGEYLLVAESTGDSSLQFQVVPSVWNSQPLTPGTIVDSSLSKAGQQNTYIVSGTAGQRLLFDGLAGSNTSARLLSPSGVVVFTTSTDSNSNLVTLQENGNYRLLIDATGTTVGSYRFQLLDAASAEFLPLDSVETETVEARKTKLYYFNATQDQYLYFYNNFTNTFSSGADWAVYGPGNKLLTSNTGGADRELSLPTNGTYILALNGPSFGANSITYQVKLVTPEFHTMDLSIPVSGNIQELGQQDVYTFNGSVGQRLIFDSLSGNDDIISIIVSPSGKVIYGDTFFGPIGTIATESGPFTLIEQGTYKVLIDGKGRYTGSYSFQVLDLSQARPLTSNTDINGTLTPSSQRHLYKFDGIAEQRLYFDKTGNWGSGTSWVLYGPGNQVISAQTTNLSPDLEIKLPADGPYTLVIGGSINSTTSESYSFRVTTPELRTYALSSLGQTITNTLEKAGAQDSYTFSGTAGQRLFFDGMGSNTSIKIKLFSPSTGLVLDTDSTSDSQTPLYLTETGTYRLLVDGVDNTTGTYGFRLSDLSQVPKLMLAPEVSISSQLSPGNETDLFIFDGTAGQRLYLDLAAQNWSGANWKLFGPDGTLLVSPNSSLPDIDIELKANGTYLLAIQGSNATPVSYAFKAIEARPEVINYSLGTTVPNTSIKYAGEQDVYTFRGNVGQRILLDGMLTGPNQTIKIYGPTGTDPIVTTTPDRDSEPLTLLETGTYRLVVDAENNSTGDYSFRLLDISSATQLSLNTPTPGRLDAGRSANLYQFNGLAGQKLTFDLAANNWNGANWVLYGGSNQILGAPSISMPDFTVTLPSDGRYVLAIRGDGSAPVDYNFQVIDSTSARVSTTGLGTVESGTVANGESAVRTFSASAGTVIYLDSQDIDWDAVTMTLTSQTGTKVFDSVNASNNVEPTQLPDSGLYTMTLKGNGDYKYRILELPKTVSSPYTNPDALELNVINSQSLAPWSSKLFSFTGSVGQQFIYDGMQGFPLTTYLYNSTGKQVSGVPFSGIATGSDSEIFTLPESGTYHLLLDNTQASPTNVRFQVLDVSQSATLTLGQRVTDQLSTGAETKLYQLTGTAGQQLFFDSTVNTTFALWRLYQPDGRALTRNDFFGNDFSVILPATGNYTLAVRGQTSTPLNYSFQVLDTQPSLAVITPGDGESGTSMDEAGVYRVRVNVSDGNGGNAEQAFKIRVGADPTNHAPGIVSDPITRFARDESVYRYQVQGIDPDGDVLSYSLKSGSTGAIINEATGELTWYPTTTATSFDFTVQVNDLRGGIATQSFTVNTHNALASIQGLAWNDLNRNGILDTKFVEGDQPNIVLVVDVSSSTGTSNINWSTANLEKFYDAPLSILDTEKASIVALTQQMIGQGRGNTQVSLVLFNSYGSIVDLDPSQDGVQLATTFNADRDHNGVFDIIQNLNFGSSSGTSFTQALTTAEDVLKSLGTTGNNANLVLLTDGLGELDQSVVTRLNTFGANINAIGIGKYAGMNTLRMIDPNAAQILSPREMLDVFSGKDGRYLAEPGIAGVTVYLDLNNNGILDANEPNQLTRTDDPTTFVNETGQYRFDNLLPGTYNVRQIMPLGYSQTAPRSGAYTVTATTSGELLNYRDFGIVQAEPLPNHAPTFVSNAPSAPVRVGNALYYQAKATDVDADVITYDLPVKPDGMTISQSGIIVWNPTEKQIGSTDVIVRARDARGGIDLQYFKLEVQTANHSPTFTSDVSTAIRPQVNKLFQYQAKAVDLDSDTLSYSLVSGATGTLPSNVTIDSTTGLVRWTPTQAQLGGASNSGGASLPWQINIRVRDGLGGEAIQTLNLIVDPTGVNRSPAITSTPRTVTRLGGSYFYEIEATDPDGDLLTYSLDTASKQRGMDIKNGVLTWTPKAEQFGENPVTITVSDPSGRSATQTFSVTVTHQSANHTPEVTSTPTLSTHLEQVYQYNAAASDADGDYLLWSLDTAPDGMVIDASTGALRWQPGTAQVGHHDVAVRVLDPLGAYYVQTFTLNVDGINQAPAIHSVPITRAAQNQAYRYQVSASDPENGALSYSLGRSPSTMTIDANGIIQWTPQANQVGTHAIEVRVTDSQGATSTQTYNIIVGATPINHAPTITSTPPRLALANGTYTYRVEAFDSDTGDTLTYELLQKPEGMVIDSTTGVISWQTPNVVQNYTVVVGARDAQGLGAAQQFTLTVRNNQAPVFTNEAMPTAVPGVAYHYDIHASDPNQDAFTYSLDNESIGKGIQLDAATGRLSWTPQTADTHTVIITATDAFGAFSTRTYTLAVVADTQKPKVSLTADVEQAQVGSQVTFQALATDNVGVAGLQLLVNGKTYALDANGRASVQVTQAGPLNAVVIARDAAGNTEQVTKAVAVTSPNPLAPKVSLDLSKTIQAGVFTLIQDGVITAPTNIIGTVDDPDSNTVSYKLEAAPVSGGEWKTIFVGNTEITNNAVGMFDPSLLQNDTYILRLTATDADGNTSVVEDTLSVAGELKLGNFRLSFTDLSVPVTGIPVNLTRTYDTLTSNTSDDFGYGWRMEFRDTDLRTSLKRDPQLDELGLSPAFRAGTRVYITLPGGKREGFTFRPTPYRLNAFFGASPEAALYNPTFTADKEVTSTLSVRNASGTYLNYSSGQYNGLNGTGYNPANAEYGQVYILTTKDGTVYEIDAKSGDLLTVTDTNGNRLVYSDAAVTGFTADGQQTKEITFERDAQNRITSVKDPTGELIRYQYSAAGDLVAVVDREQNTTRMEYKGDRPHYLDKIIDPLGHTGVRTEYDEQGRLKYMVDAAGKPVEMSYDPNNSTQTVKDQLGNATTYVYDTRGNIVTEVDAEGKVTKRSYDDDNNVLQETVISDRSGPNGFTTTFTYDENRNKLSETDALGNTTYYTYGPLNRLLSETDSMGHTTRYRYDTRGNMTSTTDAIAQVTQYEYGINTGNLLSFTDADHQSTRFEYDASGFLTRMVDALGNATTYTYTSRGDRLSETKTVTTPSGVQQLMSTWTYDGEGRMLTMTDPENHTTTYEYDANGKQVAVTDALGHRTEMRYDDRGLLIETILPDETPNNPNDNPRLRSTYDAAGRELTTIDQAGRITEHRYDKVGRLIETIHPDATPTTLDDNPRSRTEYYTDGLVKAQIDERGNRTEFRYDAAGRLVETLYADTTPATLTDNPRSTTTYDDAGRRIAQTDALGHTTRFVYDDLGRLTETRFHNNTAMTTTYDVLGRRQAVTDQNGNTTSYRYDALGRLTGVKDALGQWTEYAYDEVGRLIVQEDANDHQTQYEYDKAGRRTATILPMGQRSTMTYNAVGNLQSMTDFNGEVTTYRYDAQNRLILKDFEDDADVSYSYTLTGQVATITDGRGTTTYAYNERDWLVARTDPDGFSIRPNGPTIEYEYDAAGNRTAVRTPSEQVSYTFNERNWLASATDSDGRTTTYRYDAIGNLISTKFGSGVVETRQYNDLNQLLFLKNAKINPATGQESILTSYTYTLDKVGNRLSMLDQTGRLVEYDYDALYRLKQEKVTQAGAVHTTAYQYDPVGNRLQMNDSAAGVTTYIYDVNDRLLSETKGGVMTTYSYDNNGNTLSKSSGTEQTTYVWNDENRLVGVQTPEAWIVYTYDTDGIRMSSEVNGVKTNYLVDKNRDYAQVLEEYEDGELSVTYVYGRDLISQERGSQTSFYLVDGLGSTTALTDANGSLTDTYTYAAFGKLEGRSGQTENSYQFAGEQFDENLGEYYLRQRYYNSETGRFIRQDDYEGKNNKPLTLNQYIYANANPANYIDPSGFSSIQEGNDVHNAIGIHFLMQENINPVPLINPMDSRGIFVNTRVFDPRPPINIGQKRPTYRRIIRKATGNPSHPGVRSINRQIPDLADFPDEDLYEIKPNNQRAIIDAQNKLTNAENGLASIGLTNWQRGSTYVPPTIVPVLSSQNFAVVKYAAPGVIVYDIVNSRIALQVLQVSASIIENALKQLISEVVAKAALNSRSPAAGLA